MDHLTLAFPAAGMLNFKNHRAAARQIVGGPYVHRVPGTCN